EMKKFWNHLYLMLIYLLHTTSILIGIHLLIHNQLFIIFLIIQTSILRSLFQFLYNLHTLQLIRFLIVIIPLLILLKINWFIVILRFQTILVNFPTIIILSYPILIHLMKLLITTFLITTHFLKAFLVIL